jgi:uncharacterized protein (DUF1697 family)
VTVHVALLRGVNVGRHNRLAMADLRRLLTDLGHSDVRTHLNSGNALFATPRRSTDAIGREIETALDRELNLPVKVVVRTRDELAAVVAGDPFADLVDDPARYLVSFLSAAPHEAATDGVDAAQVTPERFAVVGRELYLWCPAGLLASRLPQLFGEARLGVTATSRNWRTVTRLLELAG